MRFLPRLVVFCGLAYLCVILYLEGKRLSAGDAADPSQLFLVFGGALLVALLAGSVVALTLLPMLGDGFASLIYGGSEPPAADPLALAAECLAAGEYPEALSYYRQALAARPDDISTVAAIAHLQIQHLADPAAATTFLEHTLEKEWPPDETAFLQCRLAETYVAQGQLEKARQLLQATIAAHPQTVAAQSAQLVLQNLGS